jgi:hypothetical protein
MSTANNCDTPPRSATSDGEPLTMDQLDRLLATTWRRLVDAERSPRWSAGASALRGK